MKQTKAASEPPKGELIGYARVSTVDQNLRMQTDALQKVGCLNIYEEKVSGVSKKRPELDKAIKDLRPGDTLVVWRLDRLARSNRELYKRMDQIDEAGAGFRSLTENIDLSTAVGRVMFGLFAIMAQFERDITIERTKAGMAALKARGHKLGRKTQFTRDKKIKAKAWIKGGMKRTAVAKRLGFVPQTVHVWFRDGMPIPKK